MVARAARRAARVRRARFDAAVSTAKRLAVPSVQEKGYTRQLRRRVRKLATLLADRLGKAIDQLPARDDAAGPGASRRDTVDDDIAKLGGIIQATERQWNGSPAGAVNAGAVEALGRGAAGAAIGKVDQAVERIAAIPIESSAAIAANAGIVSKWTAQNVDLIKTIDSRHFADVARVVEDALRKGRRTRDLKKDIAARFGVSDRRAQLIARDQLASLNMRITEARQTELGIAKYRWTTSGDERVRDEHAEIDGEVFTWAKGAPGEGHPGEPINCILPGQLAAGAFVAGVRSWYSGQVVELVTASGCRLRLTVNHPVPTARGWVVAGDLRQGDKVASDRSWGAPGDTVDPNNNPAPIDQVFGALAERLGVARAALCADDLHGDAQFVEGDVDVAGAVGPLLSDGGAKHAQRGGDLVFPLADVGAASLAREGAAALLVGAVGAPPCGDPRGAALSGDGLGAGGLDLPPLDDLGRRAPAQLDTGLAQLDGDAPARQAVPLGEGLDRGAAEVVSDEPLDRWHAFGHLEALHVGATADLDAAVRQVSGEGAALHADLLAELVGGFAGLVSSDEIVEVRNGFYSGHVYDLQSITGAMVVEGLVISNCRCVAVPVFKDGDLTKGLAGEAGAAAKATRAAERAASRATSTATAEARAVEVAAAGAEAEASAAEALSLRAVAVEEFEFAFETEQALTAQTSQATIRSILAELPEAIAEAEAAAVKAAEIAVRAAAAAVRAGTAEAAAAAAVRARTAATGAEGAVRNLRFVAQRLSARIETFAPEAGARGAVFIRDAAVAVDAGRPIPQGVVQFHGRFRKKATRAAVQAKIDGVEAGIKQIPAAIIEKLKKGEFLGGARIDKTTKWRVEIAPNIRTVRKDLGDNVAIGNGSITLDANAARGIANGHAVIAIDHHPNAAHVAKTTRHEIAHTIDFYGDDPARNWAERNAERAVGQTLRITDEKWWVQEWEHAVSSGGVDKWERLDTAARGVSRAEGAIGVNPWYMKQTASGPEEFWADILAFSWESDAARARVDEAFPGLLDKMAARIARALKL